MSELSKSDPIKREADATERLVQEVLKAIYSIRFGSIEITVHEGRATLIERKEKVKL